MHVVAGLAPQDGGPSYTVPRLQRALKDVKCDASLLTVTGGNSPDDPTVDSFPHALARVPLLSDLRLSPGLRRTLEMRAMSASLIHNHGLWLMPNIYAGGAASKAAKPLIVSPRGMLAPAALKFSTLRKRMFWTLLQQHAFIDAAAWHATSIEEANDIRCFGIQAPIAVIPNGVDLPTGTAEHADGAARRTLLFLSRIHPKKGLPNLLSAWARIATERPAWDLVIAGPTEGGHRAELERQINAHAIPRTRFAGPVYGVDKNALIAAADLFVLPTLSENFGIAVAEALAAGVPAIVTKGAPWAGLESERCGWWIDHGVESLATALRAASALPSTERRAMGARARAWMARDYSWDSVAQQTVDLYRWAIEQGEKPKCLM